MHFSAVADLAIARKGEERGGTKLMRRGGMRYSEQGGPVFSQEGGMRQLKASRSLQVSGAMAMAMAILTSDLKFKVDSTPFIAKSSVSTRLSVLMINTARCSRIKSQ